MLEKHDRSLQIFNQNGQPTLQVDGNFILELFASGMPSDYQIRDLLEDDVINNLQTEPSTVQRNFFYNSAIHWLISIFDSLHDGVLIADKNAYIRYVNKSFERISGASFEDIVGKFLVDARPGARLGEVIRTGVAMLGIRRKFGDIEYITDMHPLVINGVCAGGVTIARDITEIQQLQTKLNQYHTQVNDLLRQVNNSNTSLFKFSDIFGNSSSLVATKKLAEKLAKSSLPILLRGESGTGKELFAHAIHNASDRCEQPFVVVNCAAIPDSLLESELFGYIEGAFSGAKKKGKIGLIPLANNGTLFLDEIGDMGIDLQVKLLRVLQTQEVQPLGDIKKIKANIRVIAATNAHLENLIKLGKFREDLFYRLNVAQIHIPSLRERRDDVIPLAKYFLSRNPHRIMGQLEMDRNLLQILESFTWPGNVRELENTIRFIANITDRKVITANYLPQVFLSNSPPPRSTPSLCEDAPTLRTSRTDTEQQRILAVLDQFGRSVVGKKQAAKTLGISLTTLYGKMKYLGIK